MIFKGVEIYLLTCYVKTMNNFFAIALLLGSDPIHVDPIEDTPIHVDKIENTPIHVDKIRNSKIEESEIPPLRPE